MSPDDWQPDDWQVDRQRVLPPDWPDSNERWLTTVLRARGIEPHAIDEVLQEVRIAALESSSRLRDTTRIAPWLYRIAVTCALQYRRRIGRQKRLMERYGQRIAPTEQSPERDPLDWLLVDEQQQLVRQAIQSLPKRDAELLLLKYTEDWSYRQLADHLGTSTSAIEARLHRAREKMRKALARMAPEYVPSNS